MPFAGTAPPGGRVARPYSPAAAESVRRGGDDLTEVADERGRRLDAATGILAIVLWIVGFALPGAPPTADDPPADVTTFFVDHRGAILAGTFVAGLGSVAFLWFLGSLRSYLREAEGGLGRLSAAAFGGGVAAVTLLITSLTALSAGAFEVGGLGDDTVNRAMYDLATFLGYAGGFGFAVLLGAASCSAARSGALPPWLYWLGSVAAAAQLLSTIGLFVESGFFAEGGLFIVIAFLIAAVWAVAVSVVMMRYHRAPSPAAA
jgi:hypothetical protein